MRINLFIIAAAWAGLMSSALAQQATDIQKQDAKFIMERITGIKWAADNPVMVQATQMIAAGNRAGAAALAVQQPQFLNVTVKNFGLQMSTREETIRIPLNDFTASIIGVTRDEIDARQLLFGNFYYVGDPAKLPANLDNVVANLNSLGSEVLRSNDHYMALDNRRTNIGDVLIRITGQRIVQSESNGAYNLVLNPDPGGVLTSRAFLEAHAIAGTNRRLVEYTMRQFACLPIEAWADASSSDVRIGRDIDRFPGGDHEKFQTSCKSCHTVMDGFRGAFARWNFDDNDGYHTSARNNQANGQGILNKMNQNGTVYPAGYVTTDDSWVNNANRGINETLFGWRGIDGSGASNTGGRGVNSFGRLVAHSKRFSTCMAKRAFEQVCRKSLSQAELSVFEALGTQFESEGYNLKRLFQNVALHSRCK